MTVVVDASLALKWVLNEDLTLKAQRLLRRWIRQGRQRIAPSLFAYEVAHVLYRQQRAGNITLAQTRLAYRSICRRVEMRQMDEQLTLRAFAIGNAADRPDVYDAHYLALAEDEDGEYWTADERFWNATNAIFPRVRWLGALQSRAR